MKKYYILPGVVWNALTDSGIYDTPDEITDTIWKHISIVFTKGEFEMAFDNNKVDAGADYLRIL